MLLIFTLLFKNNTFKHRFFLIYILFLFLLCFYVVTGLHNNITDRVWRFYRWDVTKRQTFSKLSPSDLFCGRSKSKSRGESRSFRYKRRIQIKVVCSTWIYLSSLEIGIRFHGLPVSKCVLTLWYTGEKITDRDLLEGKTIINCREIVLISTQYIWVWFK